MNKLVIANWKINPQTINEAKRLFEGVDKGLKTLKNIEVVVCPPFVYILELAKAKARIKIGAQNLFWQPKGAFTGEISATQLKDIGCDFVIVGHSERKINFAETNQQINQKIKIALKSGLRPIVLFGENAIEKRSKLTKKIIAKQIKECLAGTSKNDLSKIILAYEPLWAISKGGANSACSPVDVYEINLFVKNFIAKEYSVNLAEKIPLLYGGSVNSKNVKDYIEEAMSDGVLVGFASLSSKEFIKIINSVQI